MYPVAVKDQDESSSTTLESERLRVGFDASTISHLDPNYAFHLLLRPSSTITEGPQVAHKFYLSNGTTFVNICPRLRLQMNLLEKLFVL